MDNIEGKRFFVLTEVFLYCQRWTEFAKNIGISDVVFAVLYS